MANLNNLTYPKQNWQAIREAYQVNMPMIMKHHAVDPYFYSVGLEAAQNLVNHSPTTGDGQ